MEREVGDFVTESGGGRLLLGGTAIWKVEEGRQGEEDGESFPKVAHRCFSCCWGRQGPGADHLKEKFPLGRGRGFVRAFLIHRFASAASCTRVTINQERAPQAQSEA